MDYWAGMTTYLSVIMRQILDLTIIWCSRKIKPYKKAGYWLTLSCVV